MFIINERVNYEHASFAGVSIIFGRDPVDAQVQEILSALEAGDSVGEADEREYVDLKEEAGRRGRDGAILSGGAENEIAAAKLAEAAACMANSDGGGALIVGVSDLGELIGAELDAEWLRQRIWQLTGRLLTVHVREVEVRSTRLLVVRAPQALQPVPFRDKIKWRVGPQCVEIDAATWHERRMATLQFDWSVQASQVGVEEIPLAAMETAREFLRASGEEHAQELAEARDSDLLKRLNVIASNGKLTNAGVLAFVGRGEAALDFIRRSAVGEDSQVRIRRGGRSLLQELAEVFQALEVSVPTVHLPQGLIVGQAREIPLGAAREAIVNGVAHREWATPGPTVVEYVGSQLKVTSPGGFVAGINPQNILTHPSRSRNTALAELLAALRIAEREGVGIDRMFRDMVRLGHEFPEIEEVSGPYVRATLIGGAADQAWIAWLRRIQGGKPAAIDLNSLLVLRSVLDQGWVDVDSAARVIQDSTGVARSTIQALTGAAGRDFAPLQAVEGTVENVGQAWRLSHEAEDVLRALDAEYGRVRYWPDRESIARSYVTHRGRISSTELGSLTRVSPSNVGAVLKGLEREGLVKPSWPSRRGKGFHYLLA